jgi:hypothetical protein
MGALAHAPLIVRYVPDPAPAVLGVPDTVNVATVEPCVNVTTVPAVNEVRNAVWSAPARSMRLTRKPEGAEVVLLTLRSPGLPALPDP